MVILFIINKWNEDHTIMVSTSPSVLIRQWFLSTLGWYVLYFMYLDNVRPDLCL